MTKKIDKKTSKKVNKQETECKDVTNIIIYCGVQAAVISIISLLLFCQCNATMYVVLDSTVNGKIEAWQVAGIAFPIVFVACALVHIIFYVIKNHKK